MGSRLDLQTLLETTLGTSNVYFQPPPSFKIQYPCIVYERSDIDTKFANNLPYNHTKEYTLTVMDANPDSVIPDAISDLPRCSFSRSFKVNQLNHSVFTILF